MEVFEIRNSHEVYAMALEECGKSKLRDFIVSDDQAVQKIFSIAARMGIRARCLPISKMKCTVTAEAVVKKAKAMGRDENDVIHPLEAVQ